MNMIIVLQKREGRKGGCRRESGGTYQTSQGIKGERREERGERREERGERREEDEGKEEGKETKELQIGEACGRGMAFPAGRESVLGRHHSFRSANLTRDLSPSQKNSLFLT